LGSKGFLAAKVRLLSKKKKIKEKGEGEMRKLMNLIKGEEGVTAIEYGLIAAGMAFAIVVTVGLVGYQLDALFEQVRVDLGGS
jgi:pilus assembly protein Flp/PilA